MVQDYKNLKIWQLGFQLTLQVYQITKKFPKSEIFNLTSQLRRAATSIPANIVEGASRQSNKEFYKFLMISYSSLKEVESHILLSKELGYLDAETQQDLQNKINDLSRMIYMFSQRVKN